VHIAHSENHIARY